MLLNTKLEAKIGDFGLARSEEYKAAAVSISLENLSSEIFIRIQFSQSDGRHQKF